MGHFVRSCTIYTKFKSFGYDVYFFLDSDLELNHICNDIRYFSWKDFELKDTYDVIFIDSYEAGKTIYEEISKASRISVYLDDYKRLEYPSGIILNFSPDADEKFYKEKNPLNRYLLGLDYIPIREEFLKETPEKKEYLFIMMGGSDVLNLTFKITEYLQDIDIPKVVVSNDESSVKELNSISNVKVLYRPTDNVLIEHMKRAKLAISTASMSLYELSYLSVPTIIIATSPNQLIGAQALVKYHLASKYIDIKKNNWLSNLKDTVDTIIKSGKIPMHAIDGFGTQRIVDKVLELVK